MADSRISNLPTGTSLEDTDLFAVAQGDIDTSFTTIQASTADVKTYIQSKPEFVVELVDAQTVDFYAPFEMSIDSVTDILAAPTTTIQVAGAAYTLGDTIIAGRAITVDVDIAAVIRLNATKL